jgi:hypothetical protein
MQNKVLGLVYLTMYFTEATRISLLFRHWLMKMKQIQMYTKAIILFFECQTSDKYSNQGMHVIGTTSTARHFALEGERVASINADVIPQSNSQSDSKTWSWKCFQSMQNPFDAPVITSHTLQNVGCMPWSFKGGKNK